MLLFYRLCSPSQLFHPTKLPEKTFMFMFMHLPTKKYTGRMLNCQACEKLWIGMERSLKLIPVASHMAKALIWFPD